MAAKTFARQPMRVKRVYDPILAGVSDYAVPADGDLPLTEGAVPLVFNTPLDGTVSPAVAGENLLAYFSLERGTQKDGSAKPSGSEIEVYRPRGYGEFVVEANLLSGGAGAQIDYVLAASDIGATAALSYDANYLGAGEPGYYLDITGAAADSIFGTQLIIVDFRSSRFVPDNEEGYAVAGDTNAVVRAMLADDAAFYWTTPTAVV